MNFGSLLPSSAEKIGQTTSNMAEFFLFKYPSADELFAVAGKIARNSGFSITSDRTCDHYDSRTFASHSAGNIHAIDVRALGEKAKWTIWKKVGEGLQCPWIAFLLQEKTFWEMLAYRGTQEIDMFSPLPEAWDEGESFESARRGNPQAVAELWDVEVSRIENYMVSWVGIGQRPDIADRRTFAYPTDRHPYGQMWQVLDFMHALRAPDIMAPERRVHCIRP